MMNSLRIGALVAVLAAGQALGATTMSYTLELGGNNQAATWKNPASCSNADAFPLFASGSTADGQVYQQGDVITWAAKVAVSGDINGIAPHGAANMVINLALTKDGQPVQIGAGSASTAGFYSTINNGDNSGTRGTNCVPTPYAADPLELAAFPVAWSVDGMLHGRVIDGATDNGGPLGGASGNTQAYWQYPSAAGYPAGSTAPLGSLLGMGAGYTNFKVSGCPSSCGTSTSVEGIGLTTPASCGQALGQGPAFEGQINTSGLASGTYVLTLTPGTGNNVLTLSDDGFGGCLDPTAGFAKKADATQGDTITFVIEGGVTPCTRTVAGRSVFYNGSFYGAAIATDKAALLPGQTASRGTVVGTNGQAGGSNVISYSRSLNGVYIDVQPGAGCAPLSGAIAASNFEFVRLGRALNGAPVALPAPASITATAGAGVGGSDRIAIVWADNAIPNTNWVRITAKSNANGGALDLAADDVHYWGVAIGDGMNDTGNNMLVNQIDQSGPKPPNNHTTFNRALITDVWDFNKDSLVNQIDQSIPKAPNNTTTFNCLQLGVAP